jgi:hypothetical protein
MKLSGEPLCHLPNDNNVIYYVNLQHSPIYRFNRVCLLTSLSERGNNGNTEAIFTIPDVKNLSTSRHSNLDILFISSGMVHILYKFLFITFCVVIKLFYLLQKGKWDTLLVRITAQEAMWINLLFKVSFCCYFVGQLIY